MYTTGFPLGFAIKTWLTRLCFTYNIHLKKTVHKAITTGLKQLSIIIWNAEQTGKPVFLSFVTSNNRIEHSKIYCLILKTELNVTKTWLFSSSDDHACVKLF